MILSPRGVGVEHWPCNPRVSGSIPGKLFIMDLHKNHKAFIQMANRFEQTSSHNECGSAPSPHLVPT